MLIGEIFQTFSEIYAINKILRSSLRFNWNIKYGCIVSTNRNDS